MQRRKVISLPLLILAASLVTTPAIADPKTPAPIAANDANAIYKIAFDKFQSDLRAYEDKRRSINQSFKEAIDKAIQDSRALNVAGQSQMQKRQNMNSRQSAIIAATAARDAAIASLGMPPVAPTPPAKAAKPEKNKRGKATNSPAPQEQ